MLQLIKPNRFIKKYKRFNTQLTFTYSKTTIETLERGVEYGQS